MTTSKLNTPTEFLSNSRKKPTISTSMIFSPLNSRQIFRLFPSLPSPIKVMRISTSHKSSSLEITAEILSTYNPWITVSEMPLSHNMATMGRSLKKKKNTFYKYRQLNYKRKRSLKSLKTLTTRPRTFPKTTSRPSSLLS